MTSIKLPEDHPFVHGRVCTTCKEHKSVDCFDIHRDSRSRGGISVRSKCKSCDAARKRNGGLKRLYGITPKQYEELFEKQKGLCAICESDHANNSRTNGKLFVDHDHTTGEIRGLLCSSCNHALGLMKDNVGLLSRAISYLSK